MEKLEKKIAYLRGFYLKTKGTMDGYRTLKSITILELKLRNNLYKSR